VTAARILSTSASRSGSSSCVKSSFIAFRLRDATPAQRRNV
jgi:hypothetical protein